MEHAHKPGIARQGYALARLVEHFGEDCALSDLHSGATDAYASARRSAGVTTGTVNRELGALRRVLRLAAGQWRDDTGKTWLESMPMLPSVSGTARGPRPISVEEQARLLREMPDYLAELALFVLHTGLRDQEACGLRWEWEYRVAGTEHVVFVIPGEARKNARAHIVPLNSVSRSLVESRRGADPVFVFGIDGKLHRMNNRAWKAGRARAGLPDVRVHDLRHTFGMRLRAAGVSYEDRQDLLGHYAGRITTHYSRVEIAHLIECVELLARADARPDVALVKVG